MLSFRFRKKDVAPLAILGLASVVAIALVANPIFGIVLALLPLLLYIFSAGTKYLLFLFILFSPFASAPQLSSNIMGIAGAKPFNLIAALCFAGIFFHGGSLLPVNNAEKKVFFYFSLYFMIFTIASFRTLEYLPLLHWLRPEDFHSSPLRHLLSIYIQPALYFVPFFYIIKHVKEYDDISQTAHVICLSCFILSAVVLCIAFSNFSQIILSRENVWKIFRSALGMHYNAIGSLYITTYPILLHQAFKKKPFDIINLCLAILAIGLLQSRSTIIVMLLSTYLYLFLSEKKIHIVWLTSVLACFAAAWLPTFLLHTLQTGFDQGDLNAIFTNRINKIWLPLITEWVSDRNLLLFGKGRYGLMTSTVYNTGYLIKTTHAHNAYIDFFLNCGLILLSLLLGFIAWAIKSAWETGRKINDPFFWAFLICILAFLFGGFTQRDFLPKHENLFLFPVVALMINYTLLRVRNGNEDPFYRL